MRTTLRAVTSALAFSLVFLFVPPAAFAQIWEQVNPLDIPTVQTLNDVWVRASVSNDELSLRIFSVGDGGTILFSDGGDWREQPSGTIQHLNSVWGTSSDNVYAVGNLFTVLAYDGADWSAVDTEIDRVHNLHDVWATTEGVPSKVFVVGQEGTILRYDGIEWILMPSGTVFHLNGVWGISDEDVFAIGNEGTVLHFDGDVWERQTSGTVQHLRGVWGTSSDNVYAVGDNGTILKYDGQTWSALPSDTIARLNSVWGTSPCNVYAVGELSDLVGTILHFDGSTWSVQDSLVATFPDPDTVFPLKGIHGASIRNVSVVGREGFVLSLDPEDAVAPAVCSVFPVNGSEGVAVDADISATFSAVMDPSTITEATFTLTAGSDPVEGDVSYRDNTAVFDPDGDLVYATTYTATLSADIEDNLGFPLGTSYSWVFTTQGEPSDSSGSCFISAARR